MPCDSCQRLGDAMLAVLGLLVMVCVGLNTTNLLWLHLKPLVQHLLCHLTPKLDTLSRSAAPRPGPAAPQQCQELGGPPAPQRPTEDPARGPISAPDALQLTPPTAWRRKNPEHVLEPARPHTTAWGGHPAPRPAHRACIYVRPLPKNPGWTPLPPSLGGVTSEGWQGDFAGEGVPVYSSSPSFAYWNREGSGVLR